MQKDKKYNYNDYNNSKQKIYQNFRRKILNLEENKTQDEVELGQGAVSKISSESELEETYQAKGGSFWKIFFYVVFFTVISTSVIVYYLYNKPQAEDRFNKYKSLVEEINNLDRNLSQKKKELTKIYRELAKNPNLSAKLKQSKGRNLVLTAEEEEFFKKKQKTEKDIPSKENLKKVLDKNEEIKKLRAEISKMKQKINPPVIMKKDLSHEKIAFDFLTKEIGLSPKEAEKKISNVNIFDYNYDGLFVYNFYEDNFFGTFVTKGRADKTPNEVKEIAKKAYNKKLADLRYTKRKLTKEKEVLESDLKIKEEVVLNLEKEKEKIIEEKKNVTESFSQKTAELEQKLKKKEELITRLNSLNFKALSCDQAESLGYISSGFFSGLKIEEGAKINYRSHVNLLEKKEFFLTPKNFKLKEINNIYILPENYLDNNDLKVSWDQKSCKITILNKENLKEKSILILAE